MAPRGAPLLERRRLARGRVDPAAPRSGSTRCATRSTTRAARSSSRTSGSSCRRPSTRTALPLLGTLAAAVAGDKPQQTVIGWILDPRRLDAAGLEEAEQAAREASILRWFALQYPGVAGVTIERAAALEEAAAARVVRELRAEIEDPTIGRCRVCGARTAPWATLCDRCFMARGYRAGGASAGSAGWRGRAPCVRPSGVGDRRVPDLRRPAAVHEPRLALDRPLARAAEEVRLQLDRGEAGRSLGQVEDAAVAARRVGEARRPCPRGGSRSAPCASPRARGGARISRRRPRRSRFRAARGSRASRAPAAGRA